ncbi:hypothetical protein [Amycolatopsis echigonensis]|uniref:hypothetical protein n=1 Tax=Amycolatopsis echigonensis TaxID=2576905 RepID=UPI001FE4F82E|nr:hypothetical protein [Amycolatopsis echigonensis]
MPDKTVQIPTADGVADAFAVFPDDGKQHPGVPLRQYSNFRSSSAKTSAPGCSLACCR